MKLHRMEKNISPKQWKIVPSPTKQKPVMPLMGACTLCKFSFDYTTTMRFLAYAYVFIFIHHFW